METDQTPQNATSDLGLRCLPMSHKKDARLIKVYNLLYTGNSLTGWERSGSVVEGLIRD